jgi:hypothetical protein
MAEPTTIKFSYQELATLMVRQQGIKEGYWGVYVKFGIVGANSGPSPESVVPTAIVPLLEIGLQRFDEPSPIAVNAALVWSDTKP